MHPKNKELIDRLIEVTEQKKIKWDYTSVSPNEIATDTKNNRIVISGTTKISLDNLYGRKYYEFTIYNRQGDEIDTIVAYETSEPFQQTDYDLLGELYEIARRSAKRIDETIDNLLEELS